MFAEISILFTSFVVFLFFFFRRHFTYWKRKGIVHQGPSTIVKVLFEQGGGKTDVGTLLQRGYTLHKEKGLRFFGSWYLFQPALVVIDLDLCKQILTKDFHHFTSREMIVLTHEYISRNLFVLEGQEWKEMRVKLTPTFSSGKMKNMFVLMLKCAEQLREHVERVVLPEGEFEVKDLCARLTTDIIATCAFGLDSNCVRDGEGEFTRVGKLLINPPHLLWTVCKFVFLKYCPELSRVLNVRSVAAEYTTMFTKLIQDTVEYRTNNRVDRNDFIDLMMKMSQGSDGQDKGKQRLTIEEMTAQASIFFLAGFETSASTLTFCLYELSKNTGVQDRLRREIDEVLSRHEGEITYQALQEMSYMDQVMNETLRRYASLSFVTRVCTEPYTVPGTSLVIDKGVRVNIPTYAIHHDPDIYPDPYTFDPDRFSEQNSKQRHHFAFLPFGAGPRNCIGGRFGRMQVKIALTAILSRYQLTPAADTPSRLEINPYSPFTSPKEPFCLHIQSRTDLLI